MPVVFTTPQYPYQAGWSGQKPVTTQLTFRQMIDECVMWNPDFDTMRAGRMVNNALRIIADKRDWYGMSVRGQLNVPNVITTGQAVAVNGSNLVQGIGTNWTTSLIGMQFRIGFTYPYQTIYNVDVQNQILTLDTPFGGGQNITGGYNIVQCYFSLGANVKRIQWLRNQQQGWVVTETTEESLNYWDTWRTNLGWSLYYASLPPTVDGSPQWEIWPTPYMAQVFPFQAWVQPPDLVLDGDSPPPFIPSDLIVMRAKADVIMAAPKNSPYYKPDLAQMLLREFNTRLEDAENRDNALYQADVTWNFGEESDGWGGYGSTWNQSHDV